MTVAEAVEQFYAQILGIISWAEEQAFKGDELIVVLSRSVTEARDSVLQEIR